MSHTQYVAELFCSIVEYFKMKWFHGELILVYTLFFFEILNTYL